MRAAQSVIVLACLLACHAPVAGAQEPTSPAAPDYVGADACKSCHQAIYTSWSQTKHARTINRLSKDEKEGGECIRCHVTGSAEQIVREGGAPTHPNVQCESCHGPGSLHAADANARTGIKRVPGTAACESCHNDKSPKFRGFVYAAMVGFSHPVKK
jgi:hypothetical protein